VEEEVLPPEEAVLPVEEAALPTEEGILPVEEKALPMEETAFSAGRWAILAGVEAVRVAGVNANSRHSSAREKRVKVARCADRDCYVGRCSCSTFCR
jgi:hypothetical protein